MKYTFSKHWGKERGYTLEEAFEKKRAVDEAHEVWKKDSKWKPAELESDPRGGYMVTIETK